MNKIKLSAVLMCLGAVIAIPMFFSENLVIFTVFHTLLFLVIGGVEPLLNSQVSIAITSGKRGIMFGIIAMTGSLGWAVSPVIAGSVSIRFSTDAIFLALSALLIVGTFASIIVYNIQKKQLH